MSTLQDANIEKLEKEDYPWIVFRLGESQYAINSRQVSSITQLTGEVAEMPDAPDYVRGLFSLRGSTILLYDLRTIFGSKTLVEEYREFADMLEHRKHDHLHWAEELHRSINSNSDFTLTTDPHKCKFGQWYDHYQDNRSTVNFQLKKIDEPHKRLHHAAVLAQEAMQIEDRAQREQQLGSIINEVETRYIPEIVSLLDETMAVFKSSIREMVLILGEGDNSIGYIVDEVLAVQPLELISAMESVANFADTQYVVGVSKNDQGLILQLDEDMLEQRVNCR